MSRLIPVWWTVVAGLVAALVSVVATSYAAGRQLAVLDRLGPALEQINRHETTLAVVQATCCGERVIQAAVHPRAVTPVAEASGTSSSAATSGWVR